MSLVSYTNPMAMLCAMQHDIEIWKDPLTDCAVLQGHGWHAGLDQRRRM
jgi:hypothetical protein